MSPDDYRKLCPNSGRVLRQGTPATRAAGRAHVVRCDVCGGLVEVRPYAGSGRCLLYSMHFKDADGPEARDARGPQ